MTVTRAEPPISRELIEKIHAAKTKQRLVRIKMWKKY